MVEGLAADSYSDLDSTTQTIADAVTTSVGSFSLNDSHLISGSWSNYEASDGTIVQWNDSGTDSDSLSANGAENSTGDVYTFANTESNADTFVLIKVVPGVWDGTDTNYEAMTDSTDGTVWAPTSFSYQLSITTESLCDNSGHTTRNGTVTPYAYSHSFGAVYMDSVTGLPVISATLESVTTSSVSGTNTSPVNFTETFNAGHGWSSGTPMGAWVGSSKSIAPSTWGRRRTGSIRRRGCCRRWAGWPCIRSASRERRWRCR